MRGATNDEEASGGHLVFFVMAFLIFCAVTWHIPAIEVSMNCSNTGEPIIRELESSQIRGFFSGMYLACVVALVLLLAFALNKTRVVSIIASVFLVISLAVTALGFILNYQNLVYEADFIISLVAVGGGWNPQCNHCGNFGNRA